jgi:tetratricopeptide (TPR) repeat protein
MDDTVTLERPSAGPSAGATLRQGLAAAPSAQRFSVKHRETLHRLAYTALASGDFAQARRYYEGLAFYSGADGRAWRGAAAAAHAQEDYRGAWLYWTMVTLIENGPADATFYAARCQAQLGELAEACEGFDLVARDERADPALRTQAAQMLALLQRRTA